MRELTTTSYAVLGLLSVRSWTAYELTKQMSRSLSHIWPRAVSAIYKEPKLLVAHGLATASVEDNGERRRTRYSITPEGRRALEAWLARPSAPSGWICSVATTRSACRASLRCSTRP